MKVLAEFRAAAALGVLAFALASCGGGDSGGGQVVTPPPTTVGGGAPLNPAPPSSPPSTPPAASAPRFGFSAPFAFETAIGVEAALFIYQDSLPQVLRTELVDPRYLSASRTARVSFARQDGNSETISFGYDDIAFASTGIRSPGGEFRILGEGGDGESLVIGRLTPFFVQQRLDESAEVTLVSYRSVRTARTIDTRVGTAQRQVFAIIGNPAVEFGRIQRSKDYDVSGGFTGDLALGGFFTLSADTNTGIFGVLNASRPANASGGEVRVNLHLEGAHDPVTNGLSGRIRDRQGGNLIGTYQGALYGPNRDFVGIVFDITLAETGQRHIGYAYGFGPRF